jgi:adenine C2-methylase RlmN of 23S rRNA A2503 and tRNA A37
MSHQVGVIPRILSIANDLPGVNLALSLHAPTQELRCQIVPTAKAYPLDKLIAALNSYQTIRFHVQASESLLPGYSLISVYGSQVCAHLFFLSFLAVAEADILV